MAVRKIIEIDEDKCNGCGDCIISCEESALEIVDGKAKLTGDILCDGLGACLGECPTGALQLIEREAVDFDEEAVDAHIATLKEAPAGLEPLACGCPGSSVREIAPAANHGAHAGHAHQGEAVPSALKNWPLQLHLVPVNAPYFQDSELLLAADCTGFAMTDLHREMLVDKNLIIACPKLDDGQYYVEKLTEIFKTNSLKAITVLYMTVPCCGGLVQIVKQALADSGKDIPLDLIKIDFNGDQLSEERVQMAV